MIVFVNDDDAYLLWIDANTGGLVVNAHNPPTADYLKLHRATCSDISSSKRTNWTTTGFLKACSNDVNELESWAFEATGGRVDPCKRCRPSFHIDSGKPSAESEVQTTVSSVAPQADEVVGDLPFSRYPSAGRRLLGKRTGGNSRHGYGLALQRLAGQSACAYCGLSLVDSYEHWLLLQVDHVIPSTMGKRLGIPIAWMEDYSNLVLACAACNTFENQFDDLTISTVPKTEGEFFDLRDAVFQKRKPSILRCHDRERCFYDGEPWANDK